MSHWPAHALTPILETTVGGVLRAAAWRAPDRVALIDGDRRWTYGELLDEAERVARGLLTRFTPGEPVAVWAGNGPDWVLLEFAAGLAGLTLVTVNPAYQAEELAHVLGHSGARGVFLRGGAQAGILARVRDRLPRLREVITLGEWPGLRWRGRPLPEVDPGEPGADPVHLGHDRPAQGGGAHPPGPDQQRAAGRRGHRPAGGGRPGQPDAVLPRGGVRTDHPRPGADAGHPRGHGRASIRGWRSSSSRSTAAPSSGACRRC